jgi:RNA polymerase sigma factor (sigma-70 family)
MRLNREQQSLVERNMALAGHIAGQFRRNMGRMDAGELRSLAMLGLCQAAATFDTSRISTRTGKPVRFGSYAAVVIRFTVMQGIDRACKRPTMLSLDTLGIDGNRLFEPAARGDHVVDVMVREELASMQLTPRQARIAEMRMAGMNMSQIGRQLGISRERVRQIIAKAAGANVAFAP